MVKHRQQIKSLARQIRRETGIRVAHAHIIARNVLDYSFYDLRDHPIVGKVCRLRDVNSCDCCGPSLSLDVVGPKGVWSRY